MILSDLHVHTKYCDGKNQPEEIVKKAIEMGFESIGFSGHSYTDVDISYCMSCEGTKLYREEIQKLKKKYPQINILMGVERDYYSSEGDEYDYVIGSLHYVVKDGVFMDVDNTADMMVENVEKYFNGDYKAYVKSYYDNLRDIVEKTNADIVGHFDLVTKFNEGNKYFDENADWYRELALDTTRCIARHKPLFEVNTGAIARGYRTKPYPAKFILEEINKLGCDIVITSDCHNAENLGYAFEEAIEYVKGCGFGKVRILTKKGFEYRNI